MRITVLQFYTENLSYGKFSEEINRKYCEDNGYFYQVVKDSEKIKNLTEDRAFTWVKPKIILEELNKNECDYVLFLDIDAVFSDGQKRIEEFIDPQYDLICAEDYSHHSKMNAGVLLFKNSDWSKKFMSDWWDSAEHLKGSDKPELNVHPNNDKVGYFKNGLWHDQTCLSLLYEKNESNRNKIKIISNRSFNWREHNDNNFIFHAFAYGHIRNRKIDKIYFDLFNIKIDATNKSLLELSDFYNTDKECAHNYISNCYENLLDPIKKECKRFCQVGNRDESSKMWKDFFQNAKIVVYDTTNNKQEFKQEERIEYIGANIQNIKDFASAQEEFEIILDDGTHKMSDQQLTLAELFKKLKSEGTYIIEDLHTSIEAKMPEKLSYHWGDPEKTTTLEVLEEFISTGKIKSDYISEEDKKYLEDNIESCKIIKRSEFDLSSITSVIKKKASNEEFQASKLEKATYGEVDVTEILKSRAADGRLHIRASNNVFGDPAPGVPKQLKVSYDGKNFVIPENRALFLGKSNKKKCDKNDIVVVIFCFAINDWKERLVRRINRIVDSGLYDAASDIYLTLTDQQNQKEDISQILKDYKKIKLEYSTENRAEYWGVKKIDQIGKSKDCCYLFYSHIKGVFNKYKNFETKEISQEKIDRINDWIESLEFFTIDKWKDCVEKLEKGYDTVGVTNVGGWWWGNFWWTKSSYIKDNVDFENVDRWYCEAWLHEGSMDRDSIKHFEMCHYEFDSQGTDFPRFFYDGSYSFKNKDIEILSAQFGYDGIQRDEGQPASLKEKLYDVTDKIKDLAKKTNFDFVVDDKILSISDPYFVLMGPQNKCLIINYKIPGVEKVFRMKTFSGAKTQIGWSSKSHNF